MDSCHKRRDFYVLEMMILISDFPQGTTLETRIILIELYELAAQARNDIKSGKA